MLKVGTLIGTLVGLVAIYKYEGLNGNIDLASAATFVLGTGVVCLALGAGARRLLFRRSPQAGWFIGALLFAAIPWIEYGADRAMRTDLLNATGTIIQSATGGTPSNVEPSDTMSVDFVLRWATRSSTTAFADYTRTVNGVGSDWLSPSALSTDSGRATAISNAALLRHAVVDLQIATDAVHDTTVQRMDALRRAKPEYSTFVNVFRTALPGSTALVKAFVAAELGVVDAMDSVVAITRIGRPTLARNGQTLLFARHADVAAYTRSTAMLRSRVVEETRAAQAMHDRNAEMARRADSIRAAMNH